MLGFLVFFFFHLHISNEKKNNDNNNSSIKLTEPAFQMFRLVYVSI